MLEQEIYEFIKKNNLIENGDRVLLGVSGGPDSICMLDILNKISNNKLIDFEIFVAHVNHGLRENAKLDEQYVSDFCSKINVQLFVKHVNIKKIAEMEKKGLEETGRKVRYNFFDEIAEKIEANKIAIAHNKNDKVETIIMNILRGTGTRGLIGVEAQSGKYIRPLVQTKRSDIEQYLKENNIIARHDESNDDNVYTRNKIRNVVFPYLQREFNPNIIDTLDRLSDLAKEQEDYFDTQIGIIYDKICISNNENEIVLNLKEFNKLEKILQKKVILYSINILFGTTKGIEKIHIDDVIQLCNNNIGNKYLTPNKNLKVALQNKNLKIIKINT